MTAETDLPPLPERFDCTNGSAQWCYGCYTMTRDDLGDYVLAEDYDALRNASEALQAEIEALRAEVERLQSDTSFATAISSLRREKERAERLAEALRTEIPVLRRIAGFGNMSDEMTDEVADRLEAALRDHNRRGSDGLR